MNRSTPNLHIIVLASVLLAALLIGMVFNLYGYHLQQLVTAAEGNSNVSAGTSTSSTNAAMIQLSAKEVTSGVYRWTNSTTGTFNPQLKVFANASNIIKIQNPTDTKHELIIDTGADVLPSSDDIAPHGSGQLSFNPTTTGTFTYHCAYHPFTMNGIIKVVANK